MPNPVGIASVDDFVATFKDGQENVREYYVACSSYHPSSPFYSESQRLAAQLGRSRYTIRDWISGRTKPAAVSHLEEAVELGIFPDTTTDFDSANPLFPAVNRLAAMVFWTGSLSVFDGRYSLKISGSCDQLLQQKEYFARAIHLGSDVVCYNAQVDLGHELVGLKHSSLYTRLLSAMGCPSSDVPTYLPTYITSLVSQHPGFESIAGRALQQFLRIGFAEKLHIKFMPTTNASFFMRFVLHAHRSRRAALLYGREVAALIDSSLPGVFDDGAVTHVRMLVNHQKNHITPYIAFDKRALLRVMEHHPSFLHIRKPEIVWGH
ncbi:hypothetical protein HYS47_04130 [Candidatus Woesearchaeota archaeon]|nr:hypothetical protein [Candidatus Woesearchaeota archaeon]